MLLSQQTLSSMSAHCSLLSCCLCLSWSLCLQVREGASSGRSRRCPERSRGPTATGQSGGFGEGQLLPGHQQGVHGEWKHLQLVGLRVCGGFHQVTPLPTISRRKCLHSLSLKRRCYLTAVFVFGLGPVRRRPFYLFVC